MLPVDDAELGPAEVTQQIDVGAAELGRLREDVQREDVTGAGGGGGVRPSVQTGLDVRNLERVAHRVDVAGQAGTSRTEHRRHAQTGLVTH